MTTSNYSPPTERPVNRELFLDLVNTALFMDQVRFARQAAVSWLAAFPGDLPVDLIHAQLLLKTGQTNQALAILDRLNQRDPEYLDAASARLKAEIKLRAEAELQPKSLPHTRPGSKNINSTDTLGCVVALGGSLEAFNSSTKKEEKSKPPSGAAWSHTVFQVRQVLERVNQADKSLKVSLENAEQMLHFVLVPEPPTPLVAVTHLQLLQARGTPARSIRSLAEHYHRRWPECLQFTLLLAESLMDSGEQNKAVAMLHQAASRDITGQVASRLWGEDHPYRNLWPENLETTLNIGIPASVAAALGWNQLPQGEEIITTNPAAVIKQEQTKSAKSPIEADKEKERSAPPKASSPPKPTPVYKNFPSVPETLLSVQSELERVADRLNQPGLARSDGRFPVYVVMTTRRGLVEQFGEEAIPAIEEKMNSLVEVIRKRKGWRGMLFYPDESQMPEAGPVKYNDPWALKLALVDLDVALGQKGEMIGAVLIVGGPEVVPFHHLPNPVDDADDDVPSDNPYGTRDENYFIPEWPVGRVPSGISKDPQALLNVLRKLSAHHQRQAEYTDQPAWYLRWWQGLVSWLRRGESAGGMVRHKPRSFGYTAAVWRRASTMVFRPIGGPRSLHISPPDGMEPAPLPSARLGYFNLHGIIDAVEWYGQSDPTNGAGSISGNGRAQYDGEGDLLQYPVAVRPEDIVNSGRAPEVVFSEACYGTHILGKTVEETLSLKFLQAGSQAVVGSTVTSYGSVNTPLTAADYLGHSFWNYLRQGSPAGEALRRAKIDLAREMHHRQGYLDGEDQKTLISFVLFGDPLAQPLGVGHEAKSILRPIRPPRGIKTVCDRCREEDNSQPVPADVLAYVKNVVEQYLPGMQGAMVKLSYEHPECDAGDHLCPTAQLGAKSPDLTLAQRPKRRVVVLSKEVANATHTHRHYARLTLDEQNQLVKLVVSR